MKDNILWASTVFAMCLTNYLMTLALGMSPFQGLILGVATGLLHAVWWLRRASR